MSANKKQKMEAWYPYTQASTGGKSVPMQLISADTHINPTSN